MSLSSILAGFKKGLSDVGTKVATEANLFREAAADTGSKAYDTVQGVKSDITDYAKWVVNKELAVEKADPSTVSRPLYDIVGDFRKAQSEYQASWARSNIVDTIAWVANAPISVFEWVWWALDSSKSVWQRVKSATDAGLWLVSLTPATAWYQAVYNLFAPQAAKQSVERWSSTIINNLSTTAQNLWLSKDNADAVGWILFNLASIYAWAKWPKIWGAVEKSLSNIWAVPAKAVWTLANAAVQASPNLVSMVADHLQNGGNLSNADAIYDTMAQSLALIPLWKSKGLSAKLAKEPVPEQMSIPEEAPVSKMETAPIKIQTPDEVIAGYKPVEAVVPKSQVVPEQMQMKTRWQNIEENYNTIVDTGKLDWKKVSKQEKEYAAYIKQQKEWSPVIPTPEKFTPTPQDYTINRDQANVMTKEDIKTYLTENAENILSTWKFNGRKLRKDEIKTLQVIAANKKMQADEQRNTTAGDNAWVIYKEPALLSAPKAPEKFIPTPIPQRNLEAEARARVTEIKANEKKAQQEIIDKNTRQESLYENLPEEAFPSKISLSAKLAKWGEAPVLSTTETPIAPVKDTAGQNAKWEEASLLSSDTSNGFDTNKEDTNTPSLSKSLSDISNSLSLDNVYVSKSKNVLNQAGTIGGYVEKWLSKVLNRDINLRNITQSARNSANLFANKILESVGVDKTQSNITRDINIKPEDIVGGVTPNEWTTISSIKQVQSVLDNIIPNAIKNFVGKKAVPSLENQAKAEYIYEVNKWNQEKLNTLLSPDEQIAIQSRIVARDKASWDLAQHLVDNRFLKDKDLAKDYVRYVLSEAWRDKLKSADSVVIAINGKDYKFDSIDQALTSMMARRKSGDGHIADSMETAISSIVKEKSTGIDTLRVHSPTVQLLSYSMEVWKLLQNKAVLDNFRKFQKWADGLPTAESKFIEGLFPDHWPSEKLEQIIGINRRDAGISGQAQDILSWITKATSTGILAGRLWTAIQPFFSSVPKGGLVAIKNIIWGNGVSLSWIKDQKVSEILDANWFTPDYQVFDTSWAGKVEGGLHWLAAESSGRTPELAAKTYTSLSEMRKVLNDNGMKTSSSPIEIATNWEKFARDPKNKNQYLIAQDRIQETLDWMGWSTIFNKSMGDIVRKTNFQALTGYTNWQVNKAMSDIWRVLWVIETWEKWSGQQVDAAKRIAGTAAVWWLVAAWAYGYMKNQNPEASEESLLDMAIQYANKQAWNPLQWWYAVTSWVTNSPVVAGVWLLKDFVTTGYSFLVDSPDKKVQADRMLNNIIKLQWWLSTAETISGWALTQWVANALDTVNTSDITESWNARWVKDYGLSAALLWFKPNTMMQNYLYWKVNEESLKESLGVKDWFVGDQIVNAATLGKEWIRKVMTPLQDIANSLTPDRTDWGRMQAIHDTYKKLTLEDNASSFLWKIWVTDPKLKDLFVSEIVSLVKNEKWDITKKAATGNEFAASLTWVGGVQRVVVDKFGKMMADIELSNPYLYNQILAWATSIAQEVARRGGEFPADKNTAWVVKSLMSSSSSKDDAAIAGITQHNPNSTAFWEALWTAFGGMVWKNPTAKDTQKWLKFLDWIMWEVYKGWQYTTGLERSIALKAFSILPGIADRIKEYGWKAIGELLTWMPFLSHALQQWLRYRWWVPDGTTTKPISKGTGLSSKLSSSWTAKSTATTVLPQTTQWLLTTLPTDTKVKGKSGKLDLKDKYYRVQPWQATKVLSLSDLLSRK